MSIRNMLSNSVSECIVDIIATKGYPVLPDGNERHCRSFLRIADSMWNDAEVDRHIKGGNHLENGRWIPVEPCGWNTDTAEIVNDSLETGDNGKAILEITGLSCNCGMVVDKSVRYTNTPEKIMQMVSSKLRKTIVVY